MNATTSADLVGLDMNDLGLRLGLWSVVRRGDRCRSVPVGLLG